MATDVENMKTRRSAILAELAALDSTKAGGKPNAEAAGVDHVGYKDGLYRELQYLDELIAAGAEESDGPWEEITPVSCW